MRQVDKRRQVDLRSYFFSSYIMVDISFEDLLIIMQFYSPNM